MTLFLPLLAACVTPDPPPPIPISAAPSAPAERSSKQKGGASAKAKGKSTKGAKAAPAGPVGVAGAATVEVTLAEAATGTTGTTGTMALTFSDGSTHDVPVGPIPGKCVAATATPIEQGGKTFTPIYAWDCTSGTLRGQALVLQHQDQLMMVMAVPNPAGGRPKIKPLGRVQLVPGVQLTRKG